MAEGKAERINRKLNNYDQLVAALKEIANEHPDKRGVCEIVESGTPGSFLAEIAESALKAAGEEA